MNHRYSRTWPVRLAPQENESCSSWTARLASAHGLDALSFCCAALNTRHSPWLRDIDRGGNRDLLEVLSSKTGVEIERAERTTLAAYEGRISERINLKGNSRWILPIGLNYRSKGNSFGQQYCARCLSEGRVCYYRRDWRLAFITLCVRHRVQLFDRCPHCAAPVDNRTAGRSRGGGSGLSTVCTRCNNDRSDADDISNLPAVTAAEISFQNSLLQTAERGWIEIPGVGPVYSHLYFVVVRRLMVLLTTGRIGTAVRQYINRKYDSGDLDKERQSYVTIEWLDVGTRRMLLQMVRELLTGWPHRFVECCKANKLSRQALFNHMRYIPYWYWNVVRWELAVCRYEATEQEIEAALRYLYRQYDQYGNARYFPKEVRAVGVFLNSITWRRKEKLWQKLRVPNRRLKANRSSQTRFQQSPESNELPKPQMISNRIWKQVRDLIPTRRPYRRISKGCVAIDDKTALSGMVYILATRCTWDRLPAEFGTHHQVYSKFKRWRRTEGFTAAMALCLQLYSGGG